MTKKPVVLKERVVIGLGSLQYGYNLQLWGLAWLLLRETQAPGWVHGVVYTLVGLMLLSVIARRYQSTVIDLNKPEAADQIAALAERMKERQGK